MASWPGFAYFVVVALMAVSWILVPALKEFLVEWRKK